MSTVKLPPLPDPHCGPNYHTDGFALFSDDQMQAYATQAVEADRAERQGEAEPEFDDCAESPTGKHSKCEGTGYELG